MDVGGEGPEPIGGDVLERSHDHVADPPVVQKRGGERLLVGDDRRRRRLDVEVEEHVRERVENLVQRGDAEIAVVGRLPAVGVGGRVGVVVVDHRSRHPPVGVVEAAHLFVGQIGDRTRPVRRAVDGRVVAHHEHPVGRLVDVELDGISAGGHRRLHGEQGARRRLSGPALVGPVQDPALEPGVGDHGADGTEIAALATVATWRGRSPAAPGGSLSAKPAEHFRNGPRASASPSGRS